MENYSGTTRQNAVDSPKTISLVAQALVNGQQQRLHAGDDRPKPALTSTSRAVATAAAWMDGAKVRFRENPLTTVGVFAVIAFVWGATR